MTIQLTFTQCKQIKANGYQLDKALELLNNVPTFIKSMQTIDNVGDINAIIQGGCASGAYMPAVTYHTALQCMASHSTEVEDMLDENEFTFQPKFESFAAFASELVSAAVEMWAHSFADMLDNVDWD